jgi:LmbE family N-acetylglucosaminyl deacetylase
MPRSVFAIVAHPDDIEFSMAGTLLLLKQRGWVVHCMNVANGCCGTTGLPKAEIVRLRREESLAAARRLGAIHHESLTDDLAILYTPELLARLGAAIREATPDILLTHSPADYMEDHQNTCRLAVSAAFCRGMPNFPVVPPRPSTTQDIAVYHAPPHGNRDALRRLVRSGLYVDISPVIEEKAALLACHRSQKEWLDASQGMDSYRETMRKLSREVGKLSEHYAYAEGWRRHTHAGLSAADADPLREALADACRVDERHEQELEG